MVCRKRVLMNRLTGTKLKEFVSRQKNRIINAAAVFAIAQSEPPAENLAIHAFQEPIKDE